MWAEAAMIAASIAQSIESAKYQQYNGLSGGYGIQHVPKVARICSYCRSEYLSHRCDSCGAAQPIVNVSKGPAFDVTKFYGVTVVNEASAYVLK